MTRVNTNVSSLTAQNRLQRTNNDLQTALTRLSTGLRINSGKDDPAGLIASESLRSDITSINKALTNTSRANQIIGTADSALGQVSSLLNDIRGLVTEAANKGALSDDEIAANQIQVDSSLEAINRIAQTTTFQGRRLLDGSLDFVTKAGTGFSTVADLQIDQANLGATGSVAINVNISSAATRATITTDGIAATTVASKATVDLNFGTAGAASQGTVSVGLQNSYSLGDEASTFVELANASTPGAEAKGTLTIAAGLSLDLGVRDGSVRDGSLGNGVQVKLNTISSGVSNGSFDNSTGVLTLNLREGQSGAQVVTDLANDADLNQVFSFGNGSAKTTSVRTLTTASSALAIKLSAVAGEALDGVRANTANVVVTTSATVGSTAATYDAASNQLNVVLETGLGAAALETALGSTVAADLIDFTVTGAGTTAAGDTSTYSTGSGIVNTTPGAGEIVRSSQATAVNLTNVLSGGDQTLAAAAKLFKLAAVDGGPADGEKGNSTTIEFTTGATRDAIYDEATNKITLTLNEGDTVSSIATLINSKLSGKFVASNVAAATKDYKYSATDNGVSTVTFADGTSPLTPTASFQLKARSGGAVDGTTINSTKVVFTAGSTGTSSASYDVATNQLKVTVGKNNTIDQVLTAIGKDQKANFEVVAGQTVLGTSLFSIDDATDDFVTKTPTVVTAGTAFDGKITVQSKKTDVAFNKTIKLIASNGPNEGNATASIVGGNIEVLVSNQGDGKVALSKIRDAINTLDDYSATLDVSSATGDQFLFVNGETIPATTAVALTGGSQGGGLDADLAFNLIGSDGTQSFEFSKGATLSTIVSGINSFKDATGVEAFNDAGVLKLTSTKYGSKSTVAIETLNNKTGGAFTTKLSSTRASGTDIVATVNGFAATGDGNKLAVTTSSLALSLTVDAGSAASVNFDITGGGALFQLGGDVVSNQQARLGIGSLSTAKLGGTSGRLFELANGKGKSLANDISSAANVIDEVINKVTSLRGRLGAFQRTTLESNSVSLNDTLSNLNEAQSSIRDADFAKESANLTRAQILVQSGTSVLGIANQSSQSVLSLLR